MTSYLDFLTCKNKNCIPQKHIISQFQHWKYQAQPIQLVIDARLETHCTLRIWCPFEGSHNCGSSDLNGPLRTVKFNFIYVLLNVAFIVLTLLCCGREAAEIMLTFSAQSMLHATWLKLLAISVNVSFYVSVTDIILFLGNWPGHFKVQITQAFKSSITSNALIIMHCNIRR